MKCRACWAEKAYRRKLSGWRDRLLACCGLVPLKCQHCFTKFWTPWILTLGRRLDPPATGLAQSPPSAAAQVPRRRAEGRTVETQQRPGQRRRAA